MESDLVAYYARRAAEYERIYAKPERQADLQRLRRLCAGLFPGDAVLELSCGTGYWTEVIAPTAASVLATDINEEVLAIARGKDWSTSRVEFRAADCYALPDFGRRFAAGFAGFWWSHVPRRRLRGFLRHFHAALAPNARVAFVDNRFVAGSSTPIHRVDEAGDSFQLRKLDDGSVHEVRKNFPEESDLKAALADMATDIEVASFDYFWLLTYRLSDADSSAPPAPCVGPDSC